MRLKKRKFIAYRILDDCVNCGVCIDECPQGAIIEGEEKASIDPDKCIECGHCIDEFFCPAYAIVRD